MKFWMDFDLDDDENAPPVYAMDEARRVLTQAHPEINSFREHSSRIHVVDGRRVFTVEVHGDEPITQGGKQ